MSADLSDTTIAADDEALQAFQKMQRTGATQLIVTNSDRALGIIGIEDLLPFLKLKLEFEGPSNNGATSHNGRSRPIRKNASTPPPGESGEAGRQAFVVEFVRILPPPVKECDHDGKRPATR